jgi:diacylglycerol O-acyltransferase
MSALGQAPAILTPLLRMQGIVRPPYNLIISNVPARAPPTTGTAPRWSAPTRCRSRSTAWRSTSPARRTTARWPSASPAVRRTVPHLQVLLTYLDDEVKALEKAAGV